MKGVVFKGSRQLELMGFPDPAPGPTMLCWRSISRE
mgnify:CR=1 FL=1|jgi:hypothetical protein